MRAIAREQIAALAERALAPAWRRLPDGLDDALVIGADPDAMLSALAAAGALPRAWDVRADLRWFATTSQPLRTVSWPTEPKAKLRPRPELVAAAPAVRNRALLSAALGGLAHALTARYLGVAPREALVHGVAAACDDVLVGGADALELALRPTAGRSPSSAAHARTLAALGDALTEAECLAVQAWPSLAPGQVAPERILWRFWPLSAANPWVGLAPVDGSPLREAFDRLRASLTPAEWKRACVRPTGLPPEGASAALHAVWTQQIAAEEAAAARLIRAAQRGRDSGYRHAHRVATGPVFAPLLGIWELGCAVESVDRAASTVTLTAPLFTP